MVSIFQFYFYSSGPSGYNKRKNRDLAQLYRVDVNFFKAVINEYELSEEYDIIFSSGVFHYLKSNRRELFIKNLQEHTTMNGIHALNVFVDKSFIEIAKEFL